MGRSLRTTTRRKLDFEGYVKPIEGRQFIPSVVGDSARHVAGTVSRIKDDLAIVVADDGMVTERALILAGLLKPGSPPKR